MILVKSGIGQLHKREICMYQYQEWQISMSGLRVFYLSREMPGL